MYILELDKQEWIMNIVGELMEDNEFMEYSEALEKAEIMWYALQEADDEL